MEKIIARYTELKKQYGIKLALRITAKEFKMSQIQLRNIVE